MFWIDGKWQIKDIVFYVEGLESQDISEDTIYRLKHTTNLDMHPTMPFEYGSRLKLQMPFMKEPFYGVLRGEKDGNGRWYYFLYDENDMEWEGSRFIDFTYLEVGLTSGYSSLDWIEQA